MRVGAFEVDPSAAELRDPQVISTLRPWIDAGSVGSLVLASLQEHLSAREVGSLVRPGEFFDFTRYRPTVRYDGDERVFTIPNTRVSYSRRHDGPDLLFLDVLEPHIRAEDYVDSLMELVSWAGGKSFCRIGAWYGGVPHTRPPRISHSVSGNQVDRRTGRPIPQTRRYEGPTSILNLLNERLDGLGIVNSSLMVQLPHYAQVDEDYAAAGAMLDAVGDVYGLSSELVERLASYQARGRLQRDQLDRMVARDPEAQEMLEQAEASYDAEEALASDDSPRLSPEIERFLGEISGAMDDRDQDS